MSRLSFVYHQPHLAGIVCEGRLQFLLEFFTGREHHGLFTKIPFFFIGNILSQSENRNLTKGFFDLILNDLRIHCSILSNSSLSYL